jgi:hypothetical protein
MISGKIVLSIPDPYGAISLVGYEDDGILAFYDLSGRRVVSVAVLKGTTNAGMLYPGSYLWTLEDMSHKRIAKGKFFR